MQYGEGEGWLTDSGAKADRVLAPPGKARLKSFLPGRSGDQIPWSPGFSFQSGQIHHGPSPPPRAVHYYSCRRTCCICMHARSSSYDIRGLGPTLPTLLLQPPVPLIESEPDRPSPTLSPNLIRLISPPSRLSSTRPNLPALTCQKINRSIPYASPHAHAIRHQAIRLL